MINVSLGDLLLSTDVGQAIANDQVKLKSEDSSTRANIWEKIYQDDWMKLKHFISGLVLQVDEFGKLITVNKNLEPPCQGRKPCLRYIFIIYPYVF